MWMMMITFTVPEGNGKKVLTMAEFINREAFKKSVEERYCKPCKAEGKDHNGCWCRACWVDDMLDEVECFQPSDVAPVVHGRWDDSGRYTFPSGDVAVRCTNCGCALTKSEYRLYTWNYCPICGAKMDGGDNDEAD